MPSFGDWGFVLARRVPFEFPNRLPKIPLFTLDDAGLVRLAELPHDVERVPAPINRLNDQALVGVYLQESSRFE